MACCPPRLAAPEASHSSFLKSFPFWFAQDVCAQLCFVSCLAPYPSGSLRDVDSIGGVTKSRAVNPPRWLVWAGGSLLITAREQIRGRFLTHECYTIRPGRVKTNVGCSRNSLADCQLIPWEASPTREARYITLAATKPSGVDTCILKSGDTGFDTRIHNRTPPVACYLVRNRAKRVLVCVRLPFRLQTGHLSLALVRQNLLFPFQKDLIYIFIYIYMPGFRNLFPFVVSIPSVFVFFFIGFA